MGHEGPEPVCINHPRSTTRVRCSSCELPICVQCMNETPVGMKCPACARVEYQKPLGDRRRKLAGLVGLAASAALGFGAVIAVRSFNFLVAIAVGLVTGAVIRKVAGRRPGLVGTAATATVCGLALALLVLGAPLSLLFRGFLFELAIAAGCAAIMANR